MSLYIGGFLKIMAATNQHIKELRLTAELMATIETILVYCNNQEVKKQASERLLQLLKTNNENIIAPPLGGFIIKNKIYPETI